MRVYAWIVLLAFAGLAWYSLEDTTQAEVLPVLPIPELQGDNREREEFNECLAKGYRVHGSNVYQVCERFLLHDSDSRVHTVWYYPGNLNLLRYTA